VHQKPYFYHNYRYHLYVSFACPWASRCLLFRKLKGLEDVIPLHTVAPRWGVVAAETGTKSWVFSDDTLGGIKCNEPLYGLQSLRQVNFSQSLTPQSSRPLILFRYLFFLRCLLALMLSQFIALRVERSRVCGKIHCARLVGLENEEDRQQRER